MRPATPPHLFTDLDIPEGHDRSPAAARPLCALAWTPKVLEDLGGSRSTPKDEAVAGVRVAFGFTWWHRVALAWRRGRSSRASASSSDASRSRGSRRGSRRDRTANAGKGGRSDRGTRGRGRGEHSQRSGSADGVLPAGSVLLVLALLVPVLSAPRARKRIHCRKERRVRQR